LKSVVPMMPTRSKSFITSTFTARHASGSSEDEANANNLKRTCIQQFLTQRSIQSFMFCLTEFRDPHTSDWIERFLDSNNLLEYHGTGAFNMTRFESWDTVFVQMMDQPKEKLTIQAPRRGPGGRPTGGSKNNPFLQQKQFREFHIDIDPSSLVPRILSVREQIAREFGIDLELVRIANDQILKSYENKVRDEKVPSVTFERGAQMLLADTMSMERFAPSPLRKGTYDLLQLLSLHESIFRVLRGYKDVGKRVAYAWLTDFMVLRLEDFFDGPGGYQRADDFTEELLLSSPSVKNMGDGSTELVDPLAIASDILRMRSEVLLDWKETAAEVPTYHIGLRKDLLSRQSKDWKVEAEEEEDLVQLPDDIGAFE